jgi:hypothetical protein
MYTDTGDYLYNQKIYKCKNAWAQQGIFTYLEAGTYTISGFVKSSIVRTVTLSIGIDNTLVSQYASTEVKNNLATFNTSGVSFDTTNDNEWHRYSGQVEVTKSGYTMPRYYPRTDDSNYVFFACLQLEAGTEMTLFEGYHSTWYINGNGELTHTDFPEVPDKAFQLPLSKSVWRTDNQYENGYPFNMLMPEVPAVGAFANASNLTQVSIPQSVKYIGREAFKNTKLKNVRIASDCTYFDTSFPEGCVVNFYPD